MENGIAIVTGMRPLFPDWYEPLRELEGKVLCFAYLNDSVRTSQFLRQHSISYILPLSPQDYVDAIKCVGSFCVPRVLYPAPPLFELLDNKVEFTKWMLKMFPEWIPKVYWIQGESNFCDDHLQYPVIVKPMFSVCGVDMHICHTAADLDERRKSQLTIAIIQEFIHEPVEYAAYMMCLDGTILTHHMICHSFPPFTIKSSNFPKEAIEVLDEKLLSQFEQLVKCLCYTGGMCINFKRNNETGRLSIFEINPRLGGSAFSCGFLEKLLKIKS